MPPIFPSLGILVLSAILSQTLWAQISFNQLPDINIYHPLVDFGSHGTFGTHVGVGIVQSTNQESKAAYSLTEKNQGETQREKIKINRFFLTKGTPWPIDYGLSLGQVQDQQAWQAGAHLQWTFFEGFQKPSLGLRLSQMQINRYENLQRGRSQSLVLGLSQGFWTYLTANVSIGATQHSFRWLEADSKQIALEKREAHWGIGFDLRLGSPFFSVSYDRQYKGSNAPTEFAKIAYLF